MHPLVEVEQLQAAAMIGHRRVAPDQLAESRTVDVAHAGEVEEQVLLAAVEQFLDLIPEHGQGVAQREGTVEIQDNDVSSLANIDRQTHFENPPSVMSPGRRSGRWRQAGPDPLCRLV